MALLIIRYLGEAIAVSIMQKTAIAQKRKATEPEYMFWEWVNQCTEPRGWIRYHPELARALGSDRGALVLSYAIHLDGRGSGNYSAGRWFYKSLPEWADDLAMGVEALKGAIAPLVVDWPAPRSINIHPVLDTLGRQNHRRDQAQTWSLIQRWLASRDPRKASPIYHYRVNWPVLIEWWKAHGSGYGQIPMALQCVENPRINAWKTPLLMCGKPTHQCVENPRISLEDNTEEDNTEEDLHDIGVDAPAFAGENEQRIYFLLTDMMIRGITARKLAHDLANVPMSYIHAELERIGRERVEVLAGEKKSTIRNWEGLKVAALRELAQRAKEGLLK